MTLTHLSHFDVKQIGATDDNVIFEGTLAGCRRLAFSHGMEVESYQGRTTGMGGGRTYSESADATNFSCCWFKGGGLLIKGRDGYCLVMPRTTWIND
jgi:hypothetical protein